MGAAVVGVGVFTGVADGAGVGVGVATGHAATVTMAVLETVTWLLVVRTNTSNVPPPVVNVALAFCDASAVTFATWAVPPADGTMTIWCGRPGVTPVALTTT